MNFKISMVVSCFLIFLPVNSFLNYFGKLDNVVIEKDNSKFPLHKYLGFGFFIFWLFGFCFWLLIIQLQISKKNNSKYFFNFGIWVWVNKFKKNLHFFKYLELTFSKFAIDWLTTLKCLKKLKTFGPFF